MTLNLMHPIKARSIGNSSHQIALGETLSVNRNNSMSIHAAWPAHSGYSLSAFVISDFGHVNIVSLDGYGADVVSQTVLAGAVKHTGQISHGFPKNTEQIIEARFTDRIRIIIPVIHAKYFGKHGCALNRHLKIRIANDKGLDISMNPTTKPISNRVYNYSPCIIRNGPDGVTVHAWEKYSAPDTIFAPVYDIDKHQLRLETKAI
jgi:hypothetical protein